MTSENDVATTSQQPKAFHDIKPPLSEGTISALTEMGFVSRMTPVQAATIPLFLTHKDVCVKAATGSGKTLTYLIPLLEMILRSDPPKKKREISGIVVCPTRELAAQVFSVCCTLVDHNNKEEFGLACPKPLLTVGTLRSPAADLKEWHKLNSDIIIGTPGRIEDLLCRYNEFNLSSFECLILDEADLLLNMGFHASLESILRALPKWKRVGLFSATMDSGVKRLARAGMRNPVIVNVSVGQSSAITNKNKKYDIATPASLTNYYAIVELARKLDRLVDFIRVHKDEQVVVFFVAGACVEFYGLALKSLEELKGIKIETIHGKMNQKRRSLSLENFLKSKNGGVLLCTDVVSRGIDFDVKWVVQYDPPTDPSCYIHRVGRAGRANKIGSSLVFLTEKEDAYIEFLKLKNVPLKELPQELSGFTEQPSDDDAAIGVREDSNIIKQIKKATLKSRELLEKGTRAYISYVRAYKEHQCSFIFREKHLDLGHLATSFCLLKLPKMPELAKIHTKVNFRPEPNIEFYKIPYEDKKREKARQLRLADDARNEKLTKRREEKKQEREEKKAKQEARLKNKASRKRVGRHQQILTEWDELAKEERLYKKLKRGRITQEKYDEEMFGETQKNLQNKKK